MTTMVLSETMAIDEPQRCHLMELPMELQIRIRDQLLTDLDSTVNELRPLRLVCKTFNDIWSPVVMTHIVLFRTGYTNHALAQLRSIIQGKSNASTLAAYRTLTIHNLHCVDTVGDRWCSDARRLRERGTIAVLKNMTAWLIVILFWCIALVALLIYFALTIYPIIVVIICLAYLSVQAIDNIKPVIRKFRARYYMALLSRKLNISNIRRVRLCLNKYDSDWAIYRSTRILLSLPHLTELELCLAEATDLEYLVRCLKPLKGLHKLTLFPMSITPSHLRCIAALISSNGNLTHIDWRPYLPPDFSALFCNVPTTPPLKLQHLSLSPESTIFDVLIPHLRSLTSVEFCYVQSNRWCIYFSQAKIFPTTIKTDWLDQELVTFITGHPGLVNLTIVRESLLMRPLPRDMVSSFCKVLRLHSRTLSHIFFDREILVEILVYDEESKRNFLLSTCNLREFVLEIQEMQSYFPSRYNELTLSFVAHMSHSLTVIIKTRDKAIFFLCVAFCHDSENPFIRDLARRIVYERVLGLDAFDVATFEVVHNSS